METETKSVNLSAWNPDRELVYLSVWSKVVDGIGEAAENKIWLSIKDEVSYKVRTETAWDSIRSVLNSSVEYAVGDSILDYFNQNYNLR